MISTQATPLHQRRVVRQLVKFSVVGASSTVIDKGILWLLLWLLPQVPWWVSASVSFSLAVTNSFVWNRTWTFRARGMRSVRAQYSMFLATNVVGLFLNLAITKVFLIAFTGEIRHLAGNPRASRVLVASLAAVPCVVFWNFVASKYWTFRRTGR